MVQNRKFFLRALGLAVGLLISVSVGAQENGELIQRRAVTFDAEQLQKLQERRPAAVEALAEVSLERIRYWSDGLQVEGYLAMPKTARQPPGAEPKPESLPVVIFNRGGNREFGALSDEFGAVLLAPIASWGYVVVASQYRGVAGGEGQEEFGGAEIQDVLSLFDLLDALPEADGGRIGMYGWSRGGIMTYQALTRTERLKAAIVGAGPTDLAAMVARRPEMEEHVLAELVPGWPENREAALEARSALRWVDRLNPRTPILLLHGSADWRVDPRNSLAMAEALLEARRPFRLVLMEGGDHGLSEHRSEVNRLVRGWLDHYVRDGGTWPNLEPHGR